MSDVEIRTINLGSGGRTGCLADSPSSPTSSGEDFDRGTQDESL